MYKFVFVKDNSHRVFLSTLKFSQIGSVSAAPQCICIVLVGVNVSIVEAGLSE